ncbi:MAG: vitamin B12 dependent-methionine synthase activation domain-containing protein [Bacteroidia bacterium]|nr:vitamin B12 dependent-methionine synthase activation domain-containing protein [Bacteroidia bacterium]
MKESSFSIEASEFPMEELWAAMGYRGASPDATVREISERLVGELVPSAKLRYMYRIAPAEKISSKQVKFDGVEFAPGAIIGSYLDGMTEACVFVATAGREFENAVKKLAGNGDIVADYIADSIGSVLAEMAVGRLEKDLGLGGGLSLPYSPGYCGWDIREQHRLFSLFPPEPCGIRLSESFLMTPEKSISGFFAMGEDLVRQPYHCEICQNKKCYKRKNG